MSKVIKAINNTFGYGNRFDIECRFKNKEQLCPLISEAMRTFTPHTIKVNISSKIGAGNIKVKPSFNPAVIFIKPSKTEDFITLVGKEVNLSWSKADEIEYYDKNEFFVLNNFTTLSIEGVIGDKPPSSMLKRLKNFIADKKSVLKSDFLIFIQDITEYYQKSVTRFIQPANKIAISIGSAKQITDMLVHPEFSDWILRSNYVEIDVINGDNDTVMLRFLKYLKSKRVISLRFINKISDELLKNLEVIIYEYEYLTSLEITVSSSSQFKTLFKILDCTTTCTELKSHLNLKKEKQTCKGFRQVLKYGKINLRIFDHFDIQKVLDTHVNLFLIRQYIGIQIDTFLRSAPRSFKHNMWMSSSLIPFS